MQDTSSLGLKTTLQRDTYGNVTSVNDGTTSWTFGYDQNNRLLTATDASSNTTTYGYTMQTCSCSEADRVTSIQTPDLITPNLAWALSYWPEGRLKTVTDPDGHSTSLTYQTTGELTQVTDPNSNSSTMTYDALGRLSTATDALTRAYARIYPTPTTSGWSGPAVLSGSSTSTATTTDITAALANGQYQIGVNLFQQEGDPGQVTFYRDPTFQISYGACHGTKHVA